MPLFISKPVVMEAMRWDGSLDSARAISAWSRGKIVVSVGDSAALHLNLKWLGCPPLNVAPGDWVAAVPGGGFFSMDDKQLQANNLPIERADDDVVGLLEACAASIGKEGEVWLKAAREIERLRRARSG